MEMPGKTQFAPEEVNNQTLRRADIQIRFMRRTTLNWAINNIVEMVGTLSSDIGDLSDPLHTPSSLYPLKP
jgi:hypothetical protein